MKTFAGTIEKDGDGHHSIVKRKNSTVKFVIQYLDTAEDTFPSFDKVAEAHFLSTILDIDLLSNAPMTCGNKPEAHPDNRPSISSFKANFIPGGLILNMHLHHYVCGIMGFDALCRQLAENCYAVANGTDFPSFDPKCLDRSLYGSLGFDRPSATDTLVDVPPRPERNTQHRPSQSLMFHLPRSRVSELKRATWPDDGSQISTYNAICAIMWRVISRIRQPLYKPAKDYKPVWAHGVSISKLYKNPPMPARILGNLQLDITSKMSTVPELTLAEIISEAPLSKLASYTRQMTEFVTADMVTSLLSKFANVRNKQDLSINLDSFPPMSILVSDWRYANLPTYDFGFGEPSAFRHLFGGVPLCQALVYPPRKGPAGDDEGFEVQITFETELVEQLLKDPEWTKYFEFRGVDARDEEELSNIQAKL